MKKLLLTTLMLLALAVTATAQRRPGAGLPWSNGKLQVSENGRYLCHENGQPFFWLGDTGWLLTQRLNREEAGYYLQTRQEQGYNVVLIQIVNGIPNINDYGQYSFQHVDDLDNIDKPGVYGYWDHVDYIVRTAASRGIYIGIVPTWGGPVKSGVFDDYAIEKYAKFLAERYKDSPNIIWLNGGDLNPEGTEDKWHLMGNTIKKYDPNHLMTFHPLGRTSSVWWFHDAPWLDFNMYQSGHRRYDQALRREGQNEYSGNRNEEDSWRYAEEGWAKTPAKPIIDGEPSYEGIPQGLHDYDEKQWQAEDVRRYAYWSVFGGSFGHTYGHAAVMAMRKPGNGAAYGNMENWYDAILAPGATQMIHLKKLLLALPFFDRVPDQSVLLHDNGTRYDRDIATRGKDYILVYTYNGHDLRIDLSKISGASKDAWWMDPKTGEMTYIGNVTGSEARFVPAGRQRVANDWVLVVTDAAKAYFKK
jgi:hypothetical protein